MNRGLAYDPALEAYSASAVFTIANAATDFFVIVGSPTRTVFVTELSLNGNQTAANRHTIHVIKRSADNTLGTFSILTNVPWDSANPASGAIVRAYTANPAALGAAVGNAITYTQFIGAPTGGIDVAEPAAAYRHHGPNQPLILRGDSELLALNFAASTAAGNILRCTVKWYELD